MAASRKIKLRKEDVCAGCGCVLGVGVEAWWNRQARTVTCPMCKLIDARREGSAGASALREYERRRSRREERVREKHPLIGGALLALQGDPQHVSSFKKGAAGERAVAESLARRLAGSPVVLLHDRRMPRGHGNIDHLAIAPTGVYIIDAKNIDGKVRVHAPLLGQKKLMVNGRDRTKLIDGLDRQAAAVKAALASAPPPLEADEVPVKAVLCFVSADLPLLGSPSIRGHQILYRRALVKRLKAPGALNATAIRSLADHLALAFPAA